MAVFRRFRNPFPGAALAFLVSLLTFAASARAQDVMTKESAALVKSAYVADIEAMKVKFLGLANAFPQDKYTWRPMEGVRSVSEVLMLIASEGYGFAPTALGASTATRTTRATTTTIAMMSHMFMATPLPALGLRSYPAGRLENASDNLLRPWTAETDDQGD